MGKKEKIDSKAKTKLDKTVFISNEEETSGIAVDPDELKKELGIQNYSSIDFYGETSSIGEGGVGLVLKGHDPNLGRDVAVKILRPQMRGKRSRLDRFIREARATAQIEHPNIVPVHEMGVHKDWGVYFTMKKIAGEDLKDILLQLQEENEEYIQKYTLSKLLNFFRDVCNGVSFSHSKGIIHRDLKPENIFVGDFGEVLVLDWGLVREIKPKKVDQDEEPGEIAKDQFDSSVHIDIDDSKTPDLTIEGFVSGTPFYMAPEQAKGNNREIDHRSDIYTLGVILYQILSLRLPFEGGDVRGTLDLVAIGRFIPPRKIAPHRNIPVELEAICLKAMSYEKSDRYQSIKDLVADIYNYQDDFPVTAMHYSWFCRFWKLCRRHPVISTSVAAVIFFGILGFGIRFADKYIKYNILMNRAGQYLENSACEYKRAKELNSRIKELRKKRIVKTKSPEEIKLEEKLREIEDRAENNSEVAKALLMSIPQKFQDTNLINDAYLKLIKGKIVHTVEMGNYQKTNAMLDRLVLYQKIDPDFLDEEKQKKATELRETIQGDGSLKIASEPKQAQVSLYPLVENEHGILVKGKVLKTGKTPITMKPLPKGNYLLILQKTGFPDVRFSVRIDHGEKDVAHITMPKQIPPGMVYIPAGLFYLGGEYARYLRFREVNIPSFFIKQTEITFGEYLEFFKSLKNENLRGKYMPMLRLSRQERCFINAFNDRNEIALPVLKPELPVVGITREAATAYCSWLGKKLGRECRLPTAEEWEKAARGADGRHFVWGNKPSTTHAFISENQAARKKYGFWAPLGKFPFDTSIYGVKDMGGNVREWTNSKFIGDSPFYQIKGASASTTKRFLYCAYSSDTPVVPSDVGFRYVFPMEKRRDRNRKE